MDYCPKNDYFATGELGPKPRLFVWNANTL